MSSLPPANGQPPQRSKESWRLRGVTRAAPHLDEGRALPWIIWIGAGVIVIFLIAVAAIFLLRPGSNTIVATAIPTTTRVSATITLPPPSSTALAPAPTSALTTTPLPSATSTMTVTPKPTVGQIRYRVRFGDTLTAIADKYHVSVQSIMLANRLRTDIIFEGQELIIPTPTPHP